MISEFQMCQLRLKLHINIVGCQLNGPETKRSPQSPGYSSCVRGHGCATLKSPIQGQNGRPEFPGFR